MPTTRVYFCLARESNVTEASLTFNKTKDLDSKSKNLIYFSMYNLNVNIGLHYTIKTAIGIHWSFNLRSSIGNYNLTWSTIILIALFFLQGKSLHGEAICDHPMICIWLLFFFLQSQYLIFRTELASPLSTFDDAAILQWVNSHCNVKLMLNIDARSRILKVQHK